jgi:hypothetical protein
MIYDCCSCSHRVSVDRMAFLREISMDDTLQLNDVSCTEENTTDSASVSTSITDTSPYFLRVS